MPELNEALNKLKEGEKKMQTAAFPHKVILVIDGEEIPLSPVSKSTRYAKYKQPGTDADGALIASVYVPVDFKAKVPATA